MKTFWKAIYGWILSSCILVTVTGCTKTSEDSVSSESVAEDSTQAGDSSESSENTDSDTEEQQPVTESDPSNMNYALTYDSEEIPAGLAETIATYFYAIETQNYALYLEQINPLYQETMTAFLTDNYGYGLETTIEQYHQTLVEYAGTDSFVITGLELSPASEALSDQYEEGTDFVADYLETYTTVFGEDFTNELMDTSTALYDVAVTMKAKDDKGTDITVMDGLEMLVAETEDGFGILG